MSSVPPSHIQPQTQGRGDSPLQRVANSMSEAADVQNLQTFQRARGLARGADDRPQPLVNGAPLHPDLLHAYTRALEVIREGDLEDAAARGRERAWMQNASSAPRLLGARAGAHASLDWRNTGGDLLTKGNALKGARKAGTFVADVVLSPMTLGFNPVASAQSAVIAGAASVTLVKLAAIDQTALTPGEKEILGYVQGQMAARILNAGLAVHKFTSLPNTIYGIGNNLVKRAEGTQGESRGNCAAMLCAGLKGGSAFALAVVCALDQHSPDASLSFVQDLKTAHPFTAKAVIKGMLAKKG